MLWDGEHPNLYSLQLNNQTRAGRGRCARALWFSRADNGQWAAFPEWQAFLYAAALDQDFYPQGIYTPPSADFIRREMLTSKAMGLNMLRCHIKAPDPRIWKQRMKPACWCGMRSRCGMMRTTGPRKRPNVGWIPFEPRWSGIGTIRPSLSRAS